ncbi:hypothetical protein PoB_004250200 [Plakobranchus ocellatus]|uniref:Uncharacterized protein n=1 Tax=Plakobranchus ocellatus TaxID=259542 RepID=A0AAV4B984_9GAST|nr:hypothetical protein PoB_004250200 [Plakobranchus ocellatus]
MAGSDVARQQGNSVVSSLRPPTLPGQSVYIWDQTDVGSYTAESSYLPSQVRLKGLAGDNQRSESPRQHKALKFSVLVEQPAIAVTVNVATVVAVSIAAAAIVIVAEAVALAIGVASPLVLLSDSCCCYSGEPL